MRGIRRQLAPAVARQHPVERRQRHWLAQPFLNFLLEGRNYDDPAAHCALQYLIENPCFVLQASLGAVAQCPL